MKIRSLFTMAAAAVTAGAVLCGCASPRYPELAGVYRKLEEGREPVKIAFLGGSVTFGATATDPLKTSYRALYVKDLQKRFPKARIVPIDAAIGGKGSKLGVFRMDRDVLPENPDMVVVEFAINDASSPDGTETLEGIFRKLKKNNPNVAVAVVIGGGDRQDYSSPRAKEYTALAQYYGFPVSSPFNAIRAMLDSGALKPEEFLTDAVHPNDYGYQLFNRTISSEFAAAALEKGEPVTGPVRPQTANRYESARMIELSSLITNNPTWRKEVPSVTGAWFDHQPSRWLDSVVVPLETGAGIKFEAKTGGVGVYYEQVPGGSPFAVYVDGEEVLKVNTDFKQAYPGLGNCFILLKKDGKHTITIKALGTNLRLGYLLLVD